MMPAGICHENNAVVIAKRRDEDIWCDKVVIWKYKNLNVWHIIISVGHWVRTAPIKWGTAINTTHELFIPRDRVTSLVHLTH